MQPEAKILETVAEADEHGLEVLDAHEVQVVQNAEGRERFHWAVSNALIGNSLYNPALKVGGWLEVKVESPVLTAVTGNANVNVSGRSFKPWRALPLYAGCRMRVEAGEEPVYVAFSGLKAHVAQVRVGLRLIVGRVSEVDWDVLARYVPRSLLQACLNGSEACESAIQRVLQHLKYACEMAKNGARLVRVRVGDVVYEMWVKELE